MYIVGDHVQFGYELAHIHGIIVPFNGQCHYDHSGSSYLIELPAGISMKTLTCSGGFFPADNFIKPPYKINSNNQISIIKQYTLTFLFGYWNLFIDYYCILIIFLFNIVSKSSNSCIVEFFYHKVSH